MKTMTNGLHLIMLSTLYQYLRYNEPVFIFFLQTYNRKIHSW